MSSRAHAFAQIRPLVHLLVRAPELGATDPNGITTSVFLYLCTSGKHEHSMVDVEHCGNAFAWFPIREPHCKDIRNTVMPELERRLNSMKAPNRRRIALLAAVTLVLSPTIATTASAQDGPSRNSDTRVSVPAAKYDGRDVYRGIFFGQGEVAEQLAETESFSAMKEGMALNNTPEAQATADTLMDIIEENSPGFFDRFGIGVLSGNPMRVQSALEDGTKQLETAAVTIEQDDAMVEPMSPVAVVVAVVHVLAAVTAGNLAAAVNVATGGNWVYAQNWLWGGNSATTAADAPSLTKEQAIAELTSALR